MSILKIFRVRRRPLGPGQPGLRGGPGVRRIVARAAGNVVTICTSSKILEGADRVVVQVETGEQQAVRELLVLRRGRRFAAMVNRCPHLGRSLEDAMVRGNVLVCAGHGRGYSLRPGQSRGAASALCLLPVRSDGDTLVIGIEGLIL